MRTRLPDAAASSALQYGHMKFLQAVVFVCLCAGPSFADNFLVLPFFNTGNRIISIGLEKVFPRRFGKLSRPKAC